jgi:hypothetical protein
LFILVVTSLSLVLKLMFLGQHTLVFDEATYVMIAKSFAATGFSWQTERMIGSTFPPTQFYVMAWTWLLSKQLNMAVSEEAVFRIPSVFMSTLAIPPVYFTARNHGRSVAVIASLAFAFDPYIVAYSRLAIVDMPAVFWLSCGIYCYMHFFFKEGIDPIKSPWIWLAGAFFGISAFTKPTYGLVFIPVFVHALMSRKQDRRRSALIVCQIFAMMAAVVVVVSVIGTGNAFLLYAMIKETAQTSTLPVAFWTRPSTVQILFTHLGDAIFILSIVGLLLLLFQNRQLNYVNLFYGLFTATFLLVFTPFSFARYLLIVTPVLAITFGYAFVWTYKKLKPIGKRKPFMNFGYFIRIAGLAIIVFLIVLDFLPLSRIYEAKVIDDYWITDGFRQFGSYIQENSKPTDLVMTNGHFNVIKYYSGIDSNLYMGLSGSGLITAYWMYYGGKAVVLDNLIGVDESRLKFFVLVGDPKKIPSEKVLFTEDLQSSWIKPDEFLGQYLQAYFRPIMSLNEDAVPLTLYERNTENVFNPLTNPAVYVGEPAADLTSMFVNWNGFILGNGWSSPYSIEQNGSTYWVRNAVSDDQKGLSSSFILFIRDMGRDATLRITYLDVGSSTVNVSTVSNSTVADGKVEQATTTLGQINLNGTGNVKVAEFNVSHHYFYDVSNVTPGVQQVFGLYTNGFSLPVIKVELVTKND